MSSSVEATGVRFDDDSMWVDLSDGRTLGVPLAWFPRLLRATPTQRTACRISSRGLHWEELDEDVSVAGLLAGRGDATRPDAATPSLQARQVLPDPPAHPAFSASGPREASRPATGSIATGRPVAADR